MRGSGISPPSPTTESLYLLGGVVLHPTSGTLHLWSGCWFLWTPSIWDAMPLSVPWDSPLGVEVGLVLTAFLKLKLQMYPLGILLKGRFCFSWSEPGWVGQGSAFPASSRAGLMLPVLGVHNGVTRFWTEPCFSQCPWLQEWRAHSYGGDLGREREREASSRVHTFPKLGTMLDKPLP